MGNRPRPPPGRFWLDAAAFQADIILTMMMRRSDIADLGNDS